jgi:hypothetical protein
VVTPESTTNKPYSTVASNISKDFKGASFAGRKSMEMAHKMRMKPKTQSSQEIVVPVDIMGVNKGPAVDGTDEEEDISPSFIKCYTRLKWECLRTGFSLAVLHYPFPKPLIYK